MTTTRINGKKKKVAIVFGVSGQDGSYLSELLIDKHYTVIGVTRRSSTDNTQNLSFLLANQDFELVEGDITDSFCIAGLINTYEPDEIYNLAAQSHVGTSFSQPGLTWDITAKGCLNILEAIRHSGCSQHIRFYQASSSEMFGKNYNTMEVEGVRCNLTGDNNNNAKIERFEFKYQDENTPFAPQSPYAIAKLAAHHLCRNYRDSYGIHANSGILFNHETLQYSVPLIFKVNNKIDIAPIGDIARYHTGVLFDLNLEEYQAGEPVANIEVWDKDGWTKVKYVSGYPHKGDKSPRIVNSRNSVYASTGSHVCIMDDNSEIETKDLKVGDRVRLTDYPDIINNSKITIEEAEWMGMMVGDGNIKGSTPRFTNKSMKLKKHFVDLWYQISEFSDHSYKNSVSGFTGEEIGQVECYGSVGFDYDFYNIGEVTPFGHKTKKVPNVILNSSKDIMEAFLIGYNACDGLKENPCVYRFKNFKTNSATLASGLLYLISHVTGQRYNITVEESWDHGKQQFYYSLNLLSDRESSVSKYERVKNLLNKGITQRQIHRETEISRTFIRKVKNGYIPNNTHHLELPSNEIKKIIDVPNYDGWFFDLETESGTFHAGVGQGVVHNSPRRGEKFVTRKITKWIGEFKKWMDKYDIEPSKLINEKDEVYIGGRTSRDQGFQFPKLRLGNLDAKRDWGFAGDYCKAMWLMLQQSEPDDYVIATGETYSVRDFLDAAFGYIGINNWDDYVVIDPKFYRPAEVDYLLGDCSKAKEKLGWEPKTDFKGLVEMMVEADLDVT